MKGKNLKGNGLIHDNYSTKIVHVKLKNGDDIKPHNHIGKTIYFTVIKGVIDIFLDKSETHTLNDGDILMFDGDTIISGKAKSDCNIYVFLIDK